MVFALIALPFVMASVALGNTGRYIPSIIVSGVAIVLLLAAILDFIMTLPERIPL